jgi:DNA-binding NtrC family response regulator
MLETYDWPENIRELEVTITRAYTLSSGPELEIDHLPQNVLSFSRRREAERKRDFPLEKNFDNRSFGDSVVPIATMEKRAILNAPRQTNGNKAMAIELLGIGKTTLYRKLK